MPAPFGPMSAQISPVARRRSSTSLQRGDAAGRRGEIRVAAASSGSLPARRAPDGHAAAPPSRPPRARAPAAAPACRSTRPPRGSAGSRRGSRFDARRLVRRRCARRSARACRSGRCGSRRCTGRDPRSSSWPSCPASPGDALPACFTSSPKPCTASTSALAMISRSTSCASASVSRAMMKALTPNRDASVVLAGRLPSDVVDLRLHRLDRVAVREVPVGHPRRHVARGARVAALEDLRVRLLQRLGLQVVVVEAVEVAAEAEVVLGPDARAARG